MAELATVEVRDPNQLQLMEDLLRETMQQMTELRDRIHATTNRTEVIRLTGQMDQLAHDAKRLVEKSRLLRSSR